MITNARSWLGQVKIAQNASRPRGFLSGRTPRLGAGAPLTLTDSNFSQALSAPKAVVDIWAPTCPICVQYKPVFEEVASQVGSDILMAEVNGNDAPQTAGTYQIESIPTTIFLVNGKEVHREEGGLTKQALLAAISSAFGGAGAPQTQQGSVPAPSSLPSAPVGAPTSLSAGALAIGGVSLLALAGLGYFIFKG